ncbi:head GIN domain-containing protein [Amphiplicatus metriothermophilus]|uniref:Putative auto-transporter adhesin, head GIN domain n=1 Tax=Amphiplicatus metriothermophilus TaxID=1519374 RepID=A0A239PWR0_9PROT|nr:head GIN domain-containing protein [Amphiplicatus metriothermophilus]MBB5519068.1 hypothetical protein [Amphiplicatus metriothermophilus]SNT74759.1 Putative auto-transporter adhesin, head GIN domain [Amphiplicatus metriothermophilus]
MTALRSVLTASLGCLVLVGGAAAQDVEKSYDFRNFDKIKIAGVYDLKVSVGPDYSVMLEGPAEAMERVETKISGRVLVLDQRDRRWGDKKRKSRNVTAYVTAPSLRGLHMSGVVDGEVEGLDEDAFEVSISGVGEMSLTGACRRLDAEVSGVGELDARGLICEDVRVVVSGVGEASVYARESVDAVVSGMGDIRVYGSPKKVRKSGGMFADISIQ